MALDLVKSMNCLPFHVGYFKSILKPVFVDPLDNRRSAEEAAYIFFIDFLDEFQGRSLYAYLCSER